MSINRDINYETQSATKGADCGTESENQTAQARAGECDYAVLISHHNEGKRARQQKHPEPDYDCEGMAPHN